MTIRLVQASFPDDFGGPSRLNEDAQKLFDFAEERQPDGFTIPEAIATLGWAERYFHSVSQRLRLILHNEKRNLVCAPDEDEPNSPWIYQLTDIEEDIRAWGINRMDDMQTRLETLSAVSESLVKTTDGRSNEGKRARLIERGLRHLLEDLNALREAS